MPTARRMLWPLAVAAAVVAVTLWALGAWLALHLDRRMDTLDARVDAMRGDVGMLETRGRGSDRRLEALTKRLRAVGHPLHASLDWPVSGPLLEPYGPRGSGWHSGVDVDAPVGAPVSAAAPGVVEKAGWDDGYGNRVVVAHGRGLATEYAHLATISVDVGSFVTESSEIGTIGCTGRCDGAHLHFEVQINGITSDPLLWLPPRPSRMTAAVSAG